MIKGKKSSVFVGVSLFLLGILVSAPSYACGESPRPSSECVSKPRYNPLTHLCGIVRASTDLVDDTLYAMQELTTINV